MGCYDTWRTFPILKVIGFQWQLIQKGFIAHPQQLANTNYCFFIQNDTLYFETIYICFIECSWNKFLLLLHYNSYKQSLLEVIFWRFYMYFMYLIMLQRSKALYPEDVPILENRRRFTSGSLSADTPSENAK